MLTEGMDLLAQPNPKYRSLLFVTIAHYILATNLAIFDSGLALRLSLTLLLHEAYTHKANLSNDICKKGYLPSLILQSSPFELQLFRHVRQTRRAEMSVHFDPSLQQRARDMMGCFSLCTTDCCCCCSAWQVQLRRKRLPNGWSRPLHLRPPARAAAPSARFRSTKTTIPQSQTRRSDIHSFLLPNASVPVSLRRGLSKSARYASASFMRTSQMKNLQTISLHSKRSRAH